MNKKLLDALVVLRKETITRLTFWFVSALLAVAGRIPILYSPFRQLRRRTVLARRALHP
jgi:hypothetical protein